jgi:hypothetical protein
MAVASDPVRGVLLTAAREFNSGRWFEAHEALEEALEDAPDDAWPLLLGLIQVSVGYHKASQGLRSGAIRMLGLGLAKLAPLAADAGGVDLAAFRARAEDDLASLGADGSLAPSRVLDPPPRLRFVRAPA